MKTKATVLGHALHPMLVPIPLGAVPTALVFNVLVLTSEAAWHRAAAVATTVAAVGILVAIVPGFVDYTTSVPRRGEVWTHASVHMVLGSSLAVVFATSALLHWLVSPAPDVLASWSALLLNAVGGIGLLVQGYLGGGLVEDHQVGVDTARVREEPAASERFPLERKRARKPE